VIANAIRRWILTSAVAHAAALVVGASTALSPATLAAQGPTPDRGAAALGSVLAGLGTTGRVLTIAAHPDDEDTQFIAWLTRGRHVETAYLSLTRGDGGQNLIGNELGEALGVIRTQELLSARRIDGGRQYFSRAYDFGFSKTAEETFEHWPKDTILGDVVRVVRAFRPHVMVAFFSGTPRDGHGHHQVSGILAREAYDAAADTVRFPVRGFGPPWTPQKFYRSARQNMADGTLRMNVGEYSPLLGRSYYEIAAESRSQHKSQGFGVLQRKGVIMDAISREATRAPAPANASDEKSLFDGVDTTWARLRTRTSDRVAIAALDSADAAIREVRRVFRADDPTAAVEPLARALRLTRAARRAAVASTSETAHADPELLDALWLTSGRIEHALTLAAGVVVEATAPRAVFPVREARKHDVNDSLPVQVTLFNRGRVPVTVLNARIDPIEGGRLEPVELRLDDLASEAMPVAPDSALTLDRFAIANAPTTSWWRSGARAGRDWFPVSIGAADEAEHEAVTAVNARTRLTIAGVLVDVVVPVVYRFADPVRGDQQVAVNAVPGITIGLRNALEYIRAGVPVERDFQVRILSAYQGPADVMVQIELPAGLKADSLQRTRRLTPEHPGTVVVFRVRGTVPEDRHVMGAIAFHQNVPSKTGYHTIAYEHIAPQREYAPSGMWLAAVSVKLPPRALVGYVPGVGDAGMDALQQLDVRVEQLTSGQIATTDLSRFSSIVVGPRAYEADSLLAPNNGKLLDYARRGGTLVVQYGQYEMARPGIMPYPIELARPAARVTMEQATVTLLQPTSPLLTSPNRIGPADWEGWVQERATYLPTTAAPQYRTFLSMNDPNEPANPNALLQADVGKGKYVYVTLALFRQLPNGVPGAARLLLNLISGTPPAAGRID
jgi:LmbE family N-acetylglucosaminyl deacetylase